MIRNIIIIDQCNLSALPFLSYLRGSLASLAIPSPCDIIPASDIHLYWSSAGESDSGTDAQKWPWGAQTLIREVFSLGYEYPAVIRAMVNKVYHIAVTHSLSRAHGSFRIGAYDSSNHIDWWIPARILFWFLFFIFFLCAQARQFEPTRL